MSPVHKIRAFQLSSMSSMSEIVQLIQPQDESGHQALLQSLLARAAVTSHKLCGYKLLAALTVLHHVKHTHLQMIKLKPMEAVKKENN